MNSEISGWPLSEKGRGNFVSFGLAFDYWKLSFNFETSILGEFTFKDKRVFINLIALSFDLQEIRLLCATLFI
jgi:hypothetical protein